ncbi:MAG: hypothetical protein GKS02_05520 [Alphaproteobacteria bacterium]|nr:hypothetical protein [Alphaproteobacteria bacterium]
MSELAHLTDAALDAEIGSARYFSATAWHRAKDAARERNLARQRLAGPLTQGWISYYQLRRAGLADEIRMYLSARALYRARLAAAEAEGIGRREKHELAA